MNQLSDSQIKFIKNVQRFWNVQEVTHNSEKYGFATLLNNKLTVSIKSPMDPYGADIVRVHEYGHIYNDHLLVDIKSEATKLNDIFHKVRPEIHGSLTQKGAHKILNICMDIQINSSLLTQDQVDYMDKIGIPICTPDKYQSIPGQNFDFYYEPVLRQMKFEESSPGEYSPEMPDVILDAPSDQFTPEDFKKVISEGESDISVPISIVKRCIDEELARYLKSIICKPRVRIQDHTKIYNRRSRGSELLYSSTKTTHFEELMRLAVIVDVSGSMPSELVMRILSTIQKYARFLNTNSKVALWSTSLQGLYPIMKIPDKINAGGGTELHKGLRYCYEDLGIKDILVISDLDTYEKGFMDVINELELRVHAVCYNNQDRLNGSEILNSDILKSQLRIIA